jgi:hypothetical protein
MGVLPRLLLFGRRFWQVRNFLCVFFIISVDLQSRKIPMYLVLKAIIAMWLFARVADPDR